MAEETQKTETTPLESGNVAGIPEPLEYFQRLQVMVNALSTARTVGAVADAIVNRGLSIMGSDVGLVVVLTPEADMFETLLIQGIPDERKLAWKRFPVALPTPLNIAVRERRTVVFPDREAFVAQYPNFAGAQGFLKGAVVSIPMILDSEVIGAIGLSYHEPRTFSQFELAFLDMAAMQCAQAIDRSRLIEAQRLHALQEAQEEAFGLMRGIVDCVNDSVVAIDRDMRLIAYNKIFEQNVRTFFDAQIAPGQHVLDKNIHHPERSQVESDCWARALNGEAFTIVREVFDENQSKSMQFFEISYNSLRDRNGAIVGAVHVGRNVTRRILAEDRYKQAAARLAEAQSVARLGSWELDVATGTLQWSDEMYALLGFDVAKGMPSLSEVEARAHPDDVRLRNELVKRAISDGEGYEFDMRLLALPGTDGKERWVHAIARVQKNEQGQAVRVLGTTMEITERKRAEIEQAGLTAIIEATSDFVATTTIDGWMRYCNKAFREFLRLSEADVHKMNVRDTYAPSSMQVLREKLLPSVEAHGVWSGEVNLVSQDGREVPVSIKTFIHYDKNGVPSFRSAIARDISEQKAAEDALRHAQTRLEDAQHVAHLDSWEMDALTGQIECSSEYFRHALRDPAKGAPDYMDILLLYSEEDGSRLDTAIKKALTMGVDYELDVRRKLEDGSTRFYHAIGRPVKDATGNVIKLTHASLDITERKQLEDEIRQIQKMDSIGRLAGGIAHDFNNLLAVIGGYSEILMESLPGDDPLRSSVENIQTAANRATALTQQLLAFAHKQAIVPTIVKPNDLLKGMSSLLSPLIGKNIDLVTRFASGVGNVYIDANQLEQVIVNLVVNARDAMPRSGRIVLETADVVLKVEDTKDRVPPGRWVRITASDTGVGMSPEILERLYEPFFTTKGKGKGTGLGLATVFGIIKQNGGYLGVDSRVGEGTTFRIYLPCIAEPTIKLTGAPKEPEIESQYTILVVDDEQMMRELMAKALRNRGYRVLEAADGSEALQLLEDTPETINMLVTDVIMPRITGIELARRMRETRPDVTVLLVSGFSEEMFTGEVAKSQNLPLLKKPFRTNVFIDKVSEILAGRTQ